MKNPWNNDFGAFEIMFDDAAEYAAEGCGEKGTIRCCVFPVENVDPFADVDSDSDVKRVSVLVQKPRWYFKQERPRVGDVVTMPCGEKYRVAEVDDEQNWWRILGRSF